MAEPLGERRRKMLEAQEQRDGRQAALAPWSVPSSYQVDPARRAEWLKAAAEGREEQLRIENWMRDQPHLREVVK
jgi:NADH-quinone oxidoreductase subunit B